MCTHWSGVAHI